LAIVDKKCDWEFTGTSATEDVAGAVRRTAMKAAAAIVTVQTATTLNTRYFERRLVFIDFLAFIAHSP
jgi:hypothetical protein